jgi:hypothetical protein
LYLHEEKGEPVTNRVSTPSVYREGIFNTLHCGQLMIPLQGVGERSSCRRRALASSAFYVIMAGVILWMEYFPLQQLWRTGGYLCYQNAFDEAGYLQYDLSRACLDLHGLHRASQALVCFGHRCGLSGSWINLTLDILCLTLFLSLVRAIFRRLNCSDTQASLSALACTFLPAAFSGQNPIICKAFSWSVQTGWLYWLAVPEAWFLPISRSPEPQVSLVLIALSVLIGLRLRSFWPTYVCVPFLYPFVQIPYLFCLVSIHAQYSVTVLRARPWLVYSATFLVLGLLARIKLQFLMPTDIREVLTPTHLPMLSATGTIALVLQFIMRPLIVPTFRPLSVAASLAPWAAVNLQVITGYIGQPVNFEQFAGSICCVLILVLAALPVLQRPLVALGGGVALGLLICIHGWLSYRNQTDLVAKLPLNKTFVDLLAKDSANVAINDYWVASMAALVHARQPATVFGYQHACLVEKDRFACYQQAKRAINRDPELALKFAETFKRLDALYRYGTTDFILLHSGRKKIFSPTCDPDAVPTTGEIPALTIVLVEGPKH